MSNACLPASLAGSMAASSAAPPAHAIDQAIEQAARSPCRSKRGVAIYLVDTLQIVGLGYNGPPREMPCPGRLICAGTCGQRSVHAEVRALRDATAWIAAFRARALPRCDLVHVEFASPSSPRIEADRDAHGFPIGDAPHRIADRVASQVAACRGPSCWQCSREILDVAFVSGVWLYEEGSREICGAYLGDNDATCPQLTCIRWHGHRDGCDNVTPDPAPDPSWHRYPSEEFHRVTHKRCGMAP